MSYLRLIRYEKKYIALSAIYKEYTGLITLKALYHYISIKPHFGSQVGKSICETVLYQ